MVCRMLGTILEIFFPRTFLTATPTRRVRQTTAGSLSPAASARTSASGGGSAPPAGTAVAGSSSKELLRAVLAAMVNIWPQRRCKACANAARD